MVKLRSAKVMMTYVDMRQITNGHHEDLPGTQGRPQHDLPRLARVVAETLLRRKGFYADCVYTAVFNEWVDLLINQFVSFYCV